MFIATRRDGIYDNQTGCLNPGYFVVCETEEEAAKVRFVLEKQIANVEMVENSACKESPIVMPDKEK